MRKLLCGIVFVMLLTSTAGAISARSAVVLDGLTGKTLFEQNADEILPMASTTKIMTALVALENGDLDRVYTVKKEYTLVEGSSMYLREGERISLRDTLYGLMLMSGNDAALAIAGECGGQEQFIQAMNDKADLTARQQHYETMLEQVNLRRSEVSQKLLRFKSDESVQDEKILQEKAALDQVQEQLEKAQFSAEEAEEGMNAALKEVQRLNKNLNNTQQEYHMAHTKLESLRNLAERYDGYGNSIRRVMEVRDRIHGIRGVVADIISTEKKYETAIETALGGSIQNIVTDSEETAKRLIEHLKQNKYGCATFLP